MLSKPNISELKDKAENRYKISLAVAKRARQIAKKRLEEDNEDIKDPVDIAAIELEQDKIKIVKEIEE
ncbi:MAG: DNA-directed RNA polymerase subunit omega [Clostridia bacterium]|nr:DNA-directed RNA polymerase subunit omega [Clostridia bacterium]MDD4376075.1 DNA-directed RNA polymerase subunit omega [Clostridia bacterium]